jgi:hypothetical protein
MAWTSMWTGECEAPAAAEYAGDAGVKQSNPAAAAAVRQVLSPVLTACPSACRSQLLHGLGAALASSYTSQGR